MATVKIRNSSNDGWIEIGEGSAGPPGADGADGMPGGVFGWEGMQVIPGPTDINGAYEFDIGRILNDPEGGLWISVYVENADSSCKVALNGHEFDYFRASGSAGPSWQIFATIDDYLEENHTANILQFWSTYVTSATLYKVIVVQTGPVFMRTIPEYWMLQYQDWDLDGQATAYVDTTNSRLGVNTLLPQYAHHVEGDAYISEDLLVKESITIGTGTPGSFLHILDGITGRDIYSDAAPLRVERLGEAYIQLIASEGENEGFLFSNGASLVYDPVSQEMGLSVGLDNETENYRFIFTSDGHMTVRGFRLENLSNRYIPFTTDSNQILVDSPIFVMPPNYENPYDPEYTVVVDGDLVIGSRAVGIDYGLYFDGESSYGTILWMEDEEYFYINGIMIPNMSFAYFGDTTSYITAFNPGYLTLEAETAVDIATGLQVTGNVMIKSQNELRFYEGTNYVGFEAPALSDNQIWVLPAEDGSDGDVLTTDGSGNLTWETVSRGATNLDELSDVTITSLSDNLLLAFDIVSMQWIAQTPSEVGFATVATSGLHSSLSAGDGSDHTYINQDVTTNAQPDFAKLQIGSVSNNLTPKLFIKGTGNDADITIGDDAATNPREFTIAYDYDNATPIVNFFALQQNVGWHDFAFWGSVISFISDGNAKLTVDGDYIWIGSGEASTNYGMVWNGATNDGYIYWMESDDHFRFEDDIMVIAGEKVYFRDTAIYIASQADGFLDLTADNAVRLNATLAMNANNILLDTTTGTKIGTGATQKLGFYGATPVTQRPFISSPTATSVSLKTAVDAIRNALMDVGIVATS